MRDTSSFMVVNFPLTTELDGFDGLSDLGAGNTIVFTTIPAGVKVFFAIDNNSQSKIQALQGMQIKTTHGGIYFTTIGTSTDPMVLAHWASDDMEIITPPISTFESLNGFGLTAFNQLDKAMNPYNLPILSMGAVTTTTSTTLLNKTLNCDKIDVSLFARSYVNAGTYICVFLDNIPVLKISNYYGTSTLFMTNYDTALTLCDVKNKVLKIEGHGSGVTSYDAGFTLQEYTLKL